MSDEMTLEDKKVLMQSLWAALLAAPWTKDDLITFGKAIFSKKTLKEMDDATFTQVFPFLDKITTNLGNRLTEEARKVSTDAPVEPAAEAPPAAVAAAAAVAADDDENDAATTSAVEPATPEKPEQRAAK